MDRELVAVWVAVRRNPRLTAEGAEEHRGNPGTRPLRKELYKRGMDITWLTDRIAVGGGIWNSENMPPTRYALPATGAALSSEGVTKYTTDWLTPA